MKLYKDRDELKKLYDKHNSAYKIADELGVNYKTIYCWLKRFGIKTNEASQGARKHHYSEDYFSVIDTEEKAYWLGFISADGCVYKGSDKSSYRLQINLKGSDINHLHLFQSTIGSGYKIQEKKVKEHDVCLLKVNSTKMCKDLMNHGVVQRKSLNTRLPDIPYELLKDFIRGYFDGDGCLSYSIVDDKKKWSFSIAGGREMLNDIRDFFSRFDISTNIYKRRNSQVHILEKASHDSIYDIYKTIYDNNKVSLQRKNNKFLEFVSFMQGVPFRSNPID